jgi:hypothetical protein
MKIDHVRVDLARLEALYPFETRFKARRHLGVNLAGNLVVELLDGGEPLPAVVAADPVAFGCIVGRDDVGAPAVAALKFYGGVIGHGNNPAAMGDSAARS